MSKKKIEKREPCPPLRRNPNVIHPHVISRSPEIPFAQAEKLRDAIIELLAREPVKQDPIADAEEDEAFRAAEARMEAAEAREDAGEQPVTTKARQ